MKKIILLLLTAAISLPAFAQTPDKTKLDKYFDALEANNKYMGSVVVSKDGKAIYSRSIGFADAEAGKKITADSKFRIGSISKMFTASMVMKAIEEKKLSLDDKLDKFFPTVPNASKITIKNLLGHSSGIHNFTNDEEYTSYMATPKTQAEMVAIISKGKSEFEPGTSADYSNSNYALLGFILEKVYKKSYKELLTEKIVKPLGLKNTYYGAKISPANNEVYSYSYAGKWVKEMETDMSIPGGAGAVVSNPADLAKFIEGLFAGKVVSAASLEQMKTISQGYGLGMFRFPFGEKSSYGHTGGIDRFRSVVTLFPDDKVTVAMTSNGANMDPNEIGITILNWVYNEPFDIPDFTGYNHTPAELDQYAGYYESADIPLPITITKEGTTLMAQAKGQSAFPLDATAKGKFKFEMAGLEMEFNPDGKQMVLKQGGAIYRFTKK
ncbi:peptidase [Flavobacterium album]|uniref:Peptidase n=1 Tax=Flavobacterium album TaxID=2175091 RepID=A0A2S1QYD2_9FLAO|nr:serine hydrolase domain-containing protein [Flavobacterium album]AWH85395.1 peptidase [Flavobacterium album]